MKKLEHKLDGLQSKLEQNQKLATTEIEIGQIQEDAFFL